MSELFFYSSLIALIGLLFVVFSKKISRGWIVFYFGFHKWQSSLIKSSPLEKKYKKLLENKEKWIKIYQILILIIGIFIIVGALILVTGNCNSSFLCSTGLY